MDITPPPKSAIYAMQIVHIAKEKEQANAQNANLLICGSTISAMVFARPLSSKMAKIALLAIVHA